MFVKHSSGKITARRSNGTFKAATLEDFGIKTDCCPNLECHAIIVAEISYKGGFKNVSWPTTCHRCGSALPDKQG